MGTYLELERNMLGTKEKWKNSSPPLQNSKEMGNGDTQQMVGGRHKEKMAHVKVSELPSGSVPTKEN
jgi:hypothetical protein